MIYIFLRCSHQSQGLIILYFLDVLILHGSNITKSIRSGFVFNNVQIGCEVFGSGSVLLNVLDNISCTREIE